MSQPLAEYSFFAFARRGAAADLTTQDSLTGPLPALRAELAVEVDVAYDQSATVGESTSASVELYGPGDVTGLDRRHVVRTEPADGTNNFEANYFAGIEFDHPDLPWLFTPLAARPESAGSPSGVRPWLALIVLADGEWSPYANPPPGVQAITVTHVAALQDLGDSWAWAHVQAAEKVAGAGAGATVSALLASEPGAVISRLLCPRRLELQTRYTAFLVPAFTAGRVAGLGAPDASAGGGYAWEGTEQSVDLPFYYRFAFQTADAGDFESLARRLQARVLPPEVGIRKMDVKTPGWGLPSAGDPLGLSGALRAPSTTDTNWTAQTPFRPDLTTLINSGAAVRSDDPAGPDPIVVPPIYGRWQAARSSVDWQGRGWLDQLNTDPRPRAGAGLGGEVVRQEHTQLLASAWEQVQGIERANQILRQAQLARAAGQRVLDKHLAAADAELVLAMTDSLHTRVLASPRTVRATLAASRLPHRALSPAFRRIARPLGPLRRRQGGPVIARPGLVGRLNAGEISAAPPLRAPDGMVSLDAVADRLLPGWLPAGLRPLAPWLWLLLLVLALLVIALLLVLGGVFGFLAVAAALAGAVALAGVAALWPLLKLRRDAVTASKLHFDQLTPQAAAGAPPRPGFQVPLARHQPPPGVAAAAQGSDSPEAAAFRTALTAATDVFVRAPREAAAARPADLAGLRGTLLERLDPELTLPARLGGIVKLDPGLAWAPDDPLEPVMAAPEFPQPMYEPLRDLSQENLLPGLEQVPADTVSLLVENHAFIESYMVGLNHELGRQLLFAGYPTDQRPSSFRQFWDVRGYVPQPGDPTDPEQLKEKLKDIPPINLWSQATTLGENAMHPIDPSNPDVVLLVRGELLKRYPNAQVYAARATWAEGGHRLDEGAAELHPLYHGTLAPDLTFFGFALKEHEAKGSSSAADPGWFFVLQQHPTEPRFGLEPVPAPYSQPQVKEWNDLSWASFTPDETALAALGFAPAATQPASVSLVLGPDNPNDTANAWGRDSAQTAYITFRRPVRVAIHAEAMLP